MAYRRIDDNDTVDIRRAQGGNKPETRTVAELNEYFSKEENTEIDTLQAQVGDYDPSTTKSTITDDLEQLQADVQTAETGLLDRAAALEATVQTAASGTPVAPVAATGTAFETNTLTYTAKTKGAAGNNIVVNLIEPEEDATAETVSVNGSTINVTLASAEGAITSDLDAVKAAIEGNTAADALITVAVGGTGTALVSANETTLKGGIDGTVGKAGELRYNDTTLYVSDGESTEAVDNWLSAPLLPPLPTVIDLSDATEDYEIEEGKNSIVVLTDNAATAKDIILPAAIVGLRVTIINQDNASVDISAASGEYLNGSDSTPFTLTTLNSATFYCYADGKWAII